MLPTDPTPPSQPTAIVVSATASKGQMLATPKGIPDIAVTVITPLFAILVRAGRAYLQTLVGLMTGAGLGMASTVLPPGDLFHTLKICAGLSLASGLMSILTNTLTLLTALGDRFPILKT